MACGIKEMDIAILADSLKSTTPRERGIKIKLTNKRLEKKGVCSSRNNFVIISCAKEFIIKSKEEDKLKYLVQ